jgi:hypothetical protein
MRSRLGGIHYTTLPASSSVAGAREGGWNADLPRFHVRQVVVCADEDFLERIEGAEAPFWRHVREAILASRKEL